MTPCREQIRRDAEALIAVNPDGPLEDFDFGYDEVRFARACLALLAELEQADRERDEALAALKDELKVWGRWYGEIRPDGKRPILVYAPRSDSNWDTRRNG